MKDEFEKFSNFFFFKYVLAVMSEGPLTQGIIW